MNKEEYILNQLPKAVADAYYYINSHPDATIETIMTGTGYSFVSVKRFLRTLTSAGLIKKGDCDSMYCIVT